MLAGETVAKTSNDITGCTFKSEKYCVLTPSRCRITIWDTAGLDEGPTGKVTALAALKNIRELTTLLAGSTGLSLIIYVVRGRLVGSIIKNYLLFKAFCDGKVPFVIVVTGLDGEPNRAAWWDRNEGSFHKAGLHSDGHACIVASRDGHNDEAYTQSAKEVFDLIEAKRLREPWKENKDGWFIKTVMNVLGVLLGSSKTSKNSKILQQGLMDNGIPDDEVKAAMKIYKRQYR